MDEGHAQLAAKLHPRASLATVRDWRRKLRAAPRWWPVLGGLVVGGLLVGSALPFGTAGRAARKLGPPEVSEHPPRRVVIPGSRLMRDYAQLDAGNEPARHRFVLEQVARRNLPSTWNRWVTVGVRGRRGTRVEFEVSPHGLRVGTDADWVEIPLDGPHSAAAAELLGCQLATEWMIEQTHRQAAAEGTLVHYYSASEIAAALGWHDWNNNAPDGPAMKGATFFRWRNQLLRRWLRRRSIADDTLVSGYFKAVVPPIDGQTRRGGLEMVGGRDEEGLQIQPLSGGLHRRTYFDYSHNVRLVRDFVRVDGRELPLDEFFTSVRYAREFLFRRTVVPRPAYPYPESLQRWMEREAERRRSASSGGGGQSAP